MKFTYSRYPEGTSFSSPSWLIEARWLWLDIDWNTRWPFGFCACIRIGRKTTGRLPARGLTLDLNAPLGEPNRLYVFGSRWHYMIGLISWHSERETGTRQQVIMGRETTVHLMEDYRCRPRIVRGQAWDPEQRRFTLPPRWVWIVRSPAKGQEGNDGP